MIGIIKKWIGAALAVGAALVAAALYRAGYNARQAKQDRADAKAAQTVQQKRTEARSSSDDDLNKKVDKWTRR